MLRHSFVTHLLQQDINLRYVRKLLGHNSSKSTEIYTHALDINSKDNVSPFDILVKLDTENGQPMNLGG